MTVITTSSVVDRTESDAVKRSTYVPAAEIDADVDNEDASPNVTVPGPDTFDHAVVNVPAGNPSSDAEPDSEAEAGKVTVVSIPAFTTGAWFKGGATATWTSSNEDKTESDAVKRST